MSNVTPVSDACKNAIVDGCLARCNDGTGAGYITLCVGATVVATLTLTDPIAPAASGGLATINAITSDTGATGNASPIDIARFYDSNNVEHFTTTVGLSGAGINFNTLTINAGQTVQITNGTATVT